MVMIRLFLIIKPTRCTNFSNLFWNKALHVSDSSGIYHCCVYSAKTPDDGQRNCPKHVEFYSKNKFEKLVHLFGFVIRIYCDAQSPEHQIGQSNLICFNCVVMPLV